MKYSIKCSSGNLICVIEYAYEYICLKCGSKVVEEKRDLSKILKKAKFSSRFKYGELKISVICMDVLLIYRREDINLIAIASIILRNAKLKFSEILFEIYTEIDSEICTIDSQVNS